MKDDKGWNKYGPKTFNGIEVRMALLNEICGFVIIEVSQNRDPKITDFEGSMREAVTEMELEALIDAFKTFAKHWLSFEAPRPKIVGNFKKLFEPLALLDFENLPAQIKAFDFSTL
ncbi:MAG: hypothetical protein ACOZAO_00170 [Patescibacteria group bacterium]